MKSTRSRRYRLIIWSPVLIVLLFTAVIFVQYLTAPRVTRVLIMCMDGVNDNLMTRGLHSDAMFIAEADRKKHTLTLWQIPRDTVAEISPQLGLDKVNMSLRETGPEKTLRTVGELAGCKIDHYIIMTVPDFVALMETMESPQVRISGDNPTGSSLDSLQGKTSNLGALEALQFVQKRPSSDKLRQGRQSEFLSGFLGENKHVSPGKLPKLALWAWRLDTNMSLVQCAVFARAATNSSITSKTLPTTGIYLNGYSYVLPVGD